mmetsp:Transcript_13282/g.40781  ORF Transcript_13282/g.40781 Transcript_13282/m.40781 type:complete len:240 (+) Transcript_13282:107-826(+)
MESLVKLSPKEFQFVLTPDEPASCNVTIESFCNDPVIFKMMVTDKARFSVNPPAGLIAPHQTVNVTIKMMAYSQVPPDVYWCKDMFLLQTAVKPDTKYEDISEIWRAVSKKLIVEERIRVKLSIGSGNRWKEIKQRNLEEADRNKNTAGTFTTSGTPIKENNATNLMSSSDLKAQELAKVLEEKTRECEELRGRVMACKGELDAAASASKLDGQRYLGVPLLHVILMVSISILSIRLLV